MLKTITMATKKSPRHLPADFQQGGKKVSRKCGGGFNAIFLCNSQKKMPALKEEVSMSPAIVGELVWELGLLADTLADSLELSHDGSGAWRLGGQWGAHHRTPTPMFHSSFFPNSFFKK